MEQIVEKISIDYQLIIEMDPDTFVRILIVLPIWKEDRSKID